MILETHGHPFAYEVECVLRLFYPGEKLVVAENPSADLIATSIAREGGELTFAVRVALGDFDEALTRREPEAMPEGEQELLLCTMLFELLCRQTGKRPPWGILTGVRPVRYCHKWGAEGKSGEEIIREYQKRFLVLPSKAELALKTAGQERGILERNRPNGYSLYISIPFCPTRCLYCSFVSHDIKGMKKLLPDYLARLREELREIAAAAAGCGLVLQTVYIGGGTPTTLESGQLEEILRTVAEHFDLSHLEEYTVEAGRPDTITAEKLAVLRSFGVGRLSVNPQTMDDAILQAIGRGHTAADIRKAFELARASGFPTVNADLIAGLPGETPEGFLSGLDEVIRLGPENITVHTLTVKRSSRLRGEEGAFADVGFDLSALLDRTGSTLEKAGYHPYYLYRQKGTRQNLENVGYARPGHESAYNVFIMEEVHTVLAAGAGGVTKLCAPGGKVRRIFNFKYPYEYLSRHGEVLARKSSHVIRSFYHEAD